MGGPAAASHAFAEAINRGDAAGAVACWTDDAVLVGADGGTARGGIELRSRFDQLVDAGVRLEIAVARVVVAGRVAMAATRMAMSSAHATAPLTLDGTVVYTCAGSEWRIAVDRVEPVV